MNAATRQALQLTVTLLRNTGCSDSELAREADARLSQPEWELMQATHRKENAALAPSLSEHVFAPNGVNSVECAICRRYYKGPGNDCFELEMAHAPGVMLVVCAPCIFSEMGRTAKGKTLQHGVATVYYK